MQPIDKLLEIMAALRDKDSGCPWDIEQDFKSISAYTVEEAYEVADAIERNDMHDLKDELGDLLFQVVFHAQMAKEQGKFEFDDVVSAINDKLVRRHPHVFADEQVESTEQLAERWEQHKQAERDNKSTHENAGCALDGIASSLPALRWSQKIQKRAAATGFDWPNISPVFDKLNEELAELKAEIVHENNHERILDEFGDVLFVCVNLAMHLGVNAEEALRFSNRKFISRFTTMERLIQSDCKTLDAMSLEEMEEFWQKSKQIESAKNAKNAK
ncbi:MAG: nucleoside triphosphate pyrophosphohydrolase [Gammaproteobacteria bacterium]